jgi:hypothetical protein
MRCAWECCGQVFDSAISAAYPEAAATATPVVNINMHTEGKYAFVELATEQFATAAMQLDKLDLCGRALNVARPSGYVDPATQTAQQAAMVSFLDAVFTGCVSPIDAAGIRSRAAGLRWKPVTERNSFAAKHMLCVRSSERAATVF